MNRLTLPAPAKINLFLHITGRRDDGYHEIQTVFQLLDLCDRIGLERVPADAGITVTCSGLDIPEEENLVYRAASRLREITGARHGVRITLEKNIPDGGGLGGGSSDAATVLHGLNVLWECGLESPELADIGQTLGADIPLFVHGRTAWAEGTGEELTPVETAPQVYLLIYPGCRVSTAAIFADPDLTRDTSTRKIARFSHQGLFSGEWKNDCESVVCRQYPEVREALGWLSRWGAARMTGTGSCVFLPLPAGVSGQDILSSVPEKWSAFLVNGLGESPLKSVLKRN